MNVRKAATGLALGAAIFAGGIVTAQINVNRHPYLAAAQRDCAAAAGNLERAKHANDFDMNGHGERAQQLLRQADQEIEQAAAAANRGGR